MIDKIKSFFKSFLLRWKTEEHLIKTCNRSTPLHRYVNLAISVAVCLTIFLFSLACIPASAEEGVTPRAVPSDLTGYTVTVPAGWSSSSGYGSFDISGTFYLDSLGISGSFQSLGIGYNDAYLPESNFVSFSPGNIAASSPGSFSFDVVGGNDVSNSSLLQWLADINATFVDNNPDPDPDPDPNPLVTFNKGLYRVNALWYNSDISTQLDGMMFYSLSEGDLFTALTVQNDELLFDDENGDQHVMARNTTTGAKWIDNSGQFVYFINDESIPQSLSEQIPTLLEYIPDVSLTEFQRMQDSWYYGVQDGFTEGYNQASRDTEGTFLGNIFGGVFDALDKFQMFGQFSFLDFIKSILGILALIWFLRLLAGG